VKEFQIPEEDIDHIIDHALTEDLSHGDVTTDTLIPPDLQGSAQILVKGNGIFAGGEIARRVFQKIDPSLKVVFLIKDGTEVQRGDVAATISGKVPSILKAERVALNFLQRLSGIASQTAMYVKETQGFVADILDTRKTTPGLRLLEKYAVLMGGGKSHRFHLGDAILIKDNHLAALRFLGMSLKDIVTKAKKGAPENITVEVEVTSEQEAIDAAEAGADIIMFDNMSPEEMKRVGALLPKNIRTEASGGITLSTVRKAAASGVDIISVGALTHSSKALDISLELDTDTLKIA